MKRIHWFLLLCLFFVAGVVVAQTGYTGLNAVHIFNSLMDSTTIGATTPAAGTFSSLNDTGLSTSVQICTDGSRNFVNCPTSTTAAVQTYFRKTLGSSVAVSSNTPTILDSITVHAAGGSAPAFPNSTQTWRVLVCYSYYGAIGSGVVGESEVQDSNLAVFATAEGGQFSATAGTNYHACGFSTSTYTGSSNITFSVIIENTGNQTIQTSSVLLGISSNVNVSIFASN